MSLFPQVCLVLKRPHILHDGDNDEGKLDPRKNDNSDLSLLPTELLFKVFSYLSHNDLMNLSCLSKRFYDVIKQTEFWRRVEMKGFYMSEQIFVQFLHFMGEHTQELYIRGHFDYLQANTLYCMAQIKSVCTKLKVLHINNQIFGPKMVSTCWIPETVEELDLSNTYMLSTQGGEKDRKLMRIELALPNCKSMAMENCSWFRSDAFMPISKMPKLERLNLSGCEQLKEDAFAYITLACRFGFQKLKSLDLRRTGLADHISSFASIPTLEEVYLECLNTSSSSWETNDTDSDPIVFYKNAPASLQERLDQFACLQEAYPKRFNSVYTPNVVRQFRDMNIENPFKFENNITHWNRFSYINTLHVFNQIYMLNAQKTFAERESVADFNDFVPLRLHDNLHDTVGTQFEEIDHTINVNSYSDYGYVFKFRYGTRDILLDLNCRKLAWFMVEQYRKIKATALTDDQKGSEENNKINEESNTNPDNRPPKNVNRGVKRAADDDAHNVKSKLLKKDTNEQDPYECDQLPTAEIFIHITEGVPTSSCSTGRTDDGEPTSSQSFTVRPRKQFTNYKIKFTDNHLPSNSYRYESVFAEYDNTFTLLSPQQIAAIAVHVDIFDILPSNESKNTQVARINILNESHVNIKNQNDYVIKCRCDPWIKSQKSENAQMKTLKTPIVLDISDVLYPYNINLTRNLNKYCHVAAEVAELSVLGNEYSPRDRANACVVIEPVTTVMAVSCDLRTGQLNTVNLTAQQAAHLTSESYDQKLRRIPENIIEYATASHQQARRLKSTPTNFPEITREDSDKHIENQDIVLVPCHSYTVSENKTQNVEEKIESETTNDNSSHFERSPVILEYQEMDQISDYPSNFTSAFNTKTYPYAFNTSFLTKFIDVFGCHDVDLKLWIFLNYLFQLPEKRNVKRPQAYPFPHDDERVYTAERHFNDREGINSFIVREVFHNNRNVKWRRASLRNFEDFDDVTLAVIASSRVNLEYLDVRGTAVTNNGIQNFRQAKPHCKIVFEHPKSTRV